MKIVLFVVGSVLYILFLPLIVVSSVLDLVLGRKRTTWTADALSNAMWKEYEKKNRDIT